jgi:hypothetical protein
MAVLEITMRTAGSVAFPSRSVSSRAANTRQISMALTR